MAKQTATSEDFYKTKYPEFNDEAFLRLLEIIQKGEMTPKALLSLIGNKQLTDEQARVATDAFPYPWPRRAGSLGQTQETLAHMSPEDLTEAIQFYSGLIELMQAELGTREEPTEMPRNTLGRDGKRQAAALEEPPIGPNTNTTRII